MVEKKRAKKPQDIVPLMLRLREALRHRLAKDAEKAAKSLNAEIVDRLEASYSKDERIEELRERLEDFRRRTDEVEADKERFAEEDRQQRKLLEEYRDKFRAESDEIQSKYAHLETATDMVDVLLGNETSSALVRRIVGTLAGSPDWSSNAEATKEMASKIAQLVQTATTPSVTGTLTGTVSGSLPTSSLSSRTTVAVMSDYASRDEEAVDTQGGEKNEGPYPRT